MLGYCQFHSLCCMWMSKSISLLCFLQQQRLHLGTAAGPAALFFSEFVSVLLICNSNSQERATSMENHQNAALVLLNGKDIREKKGRGFDSDSAFVYRQCWVITFGSTYTISI